MYCTVHGVDLVNSKHLYNWKGPHDKHHKIISNETYCFYGKFPLQSMNNYLTLWVWHTVSSSHEQQWAWKPQPKLSIRKIAAVFFLIPRSCGLTRELTRESLGQEHDSSNMSFLSDLLHWSKAQMSVSWSVKCSCNTATARVTGLVLFTRSYNLSNIHNSSFWSIAQTTFIMVGVALVFKRICHSPILSLVSN